MAIKAVIIQKEGLEPVPTKLIAQSISKIAEATKQMYASGLTEKAIVLLISEASGVGKREVQLVLSNMYYLDKKYLVQPKAK